jgi:hypothetical protein
MCCEKYSNPTYTLTKTNKRKEGTNENKREREAFPSMQLHPPTCKHGWRINENNLAHSFGIMGAEHGQCRYCHCRVAISNSKACDKSCARIYVYDEEEEEVCVLLQDLRGTHIKYTNVNPNFSHMFTLHANTYLLFHIHI